MGESALTADLDARAFPAPRAGGGVGHVKLEPRGALDAEIEEPVGGGNGRTGIEAFLMVFVKRFERICSAVLWFGSVQHISVLQ